MTDNPKEFTFIPALLVISYSVFGIVNQLTKVSLSSPQVGS